MSPYKETSGPAMASTAKRRLIGFTSTDKVLGFLKKNIVVRVSITVRIQVRVSATRVSV